MRIKDIKLTEVKRGLNWRLVGTDNKRWFDEPMEEWEIEPAAPLQTSDYAVYSGVFVLENGQVQPLLLIKEVSSPEYGGDYCEYVDGKWRQLGLVPNPNAPFGTEYIANAHPEDPSYVEESGHEWHASNFALHVGNMST